MFIILEVHNFKTAQLEGTLWVDHQVQLLSGASGSAPGDIGPYHTDKENVETGNMPIALVRLEYRSRDLRSAYIPIM